ncbi:MAG: hypothetical protein ACI8TX_001495 [Hyphomicrobiaceae bacterium]|jgi:uncharacterized protein (TIGR02246 family)
MTKAPILSVIALSIIAFAAQPATQVHAFGAGSGTVVDVENEKQIRALYEDFETGWNTHNADQMADMWALDGDHLEPDGRSAQGREEVRMLFTKQHASFFKDTILDLSIDSVWFVSGNVALIDGTYSVAGIKDPAGTQLPTREGHLTSVLLFEKDRWWIAASRLAIPIKVPWRQD